MPQQSCWTWSTRSSDKTLVDSSRNRDDSKGLPTPIGTPTIKPTRRNSTKERTQSWFRRRFGTASLTQDSLTVESRPTGSETANKALFVSEGQSGSAKVVNEVVVDWDRRSSTDDTGAPEVSSSAATFDKDSESQSSPKASSQGYRWDAIFDTTLWTQFVDFFWPHFETQDVEDKFIKESWTIRKRLALASSSFLIINWLLAFGFEFSKPFRDEWNLLDFVFLFGVAPAFTLPVFVMIMYDFPVRFRAPYQSLLFLATWSWAVYQILSIWLCNFYNTAVPLISCGPGNFIDIFYYSTALQTIGLFGLRLDRFAALIGAVFYFIFAAATVLPTHFVWSRSLINYAIFQLFLLYVSFRVEHSERRLFNLREHLKIQFKETQSARVSERKAAESKRRLTSYVFHEVRVPLNTALLAVQNMACSTTIAESQELEFTALQGSLNMMTCVLNDVLDFDKMDSGRFDTNPQPFAFHQVLRSIFSPLALVCKARGLELITTLDPLIDTVARRAAYEALGATDDQIERHFDKHPIGDGVVIGDEMRLRQIVTNLASNAAKFTSAGGKMFIRSSLVEGNHRQSPGPARTGKTEIVIRLEVQDTGCGLDPQEMELLFTPFIQKSGGKQAGRLAGSGLGLSLVRQIVTLSRGRLGVTSQSGVGSKFWVELPLDVGAATLPDTFISSDQDKKISEEMAQHRLITLDNAFASLRKSQMSTLDTGQPQHFGNTEILQLSYDLNQELLREQDSRVSLPQRPTFIDLPKTTSIPEESAVSDTIETNLSSPPSPSLQERRVTAPAFDTPLQVLVVDDDLLTRMLMSRLLTRLGCSVSLAENGEQALEMILGGVQFTPSHENAPSHEDTKRSDLDGRYHIVFLDNHMPILTGVEAIARLRGLGRNDFVVGLTGNALIQDQNAYKSAGVDHILTKPVLETALKRMLELAHQRRLAGRAV